MTPPKSELFKLQTKRLKRNKSIKTVGNVVQINQTQHFNELKLRKMDVIG